ncbi:hypothetical protein [Cohnella fermenti]|uniref:Uncharacterized protein n=1 Tax=Cohnella fermenti TaxID=2565925 RepID=A0A4S4BWX9_9BACL|nr:hypothetical protein [Cohnella fermenti]THF79143.1 hypothetical protein E6C55_13085 [Cohnella fermenti]
MIRQPRFGIQGPVLAWNDPWNAEASMTVMRTGTGRMIPAQEPDIAPGAYTSALKELGAEFYVHHLFPDMRELPELIEDCRRTGLGLVIGNEYGNINGPWADETNRYDIPREALEPLLRSGVLEALLYDEPEHLQINASQYRKRDWLPHWGRLQATTLREANERFTDQVSKCLASLRKANAGELPVLAEQVFPTLFHSHARAGMTPTPKIMKESFHALQLGTALGAAKQYHKGLWVCADLWGPDTGPWLTRVPGFPGHSPAEFASALRLGYHMGPSHLFTENVDGLLRMNEAGKPEATEFGEEWRQFVKDYVPANPLPYDHRQARADIAIVHSDDSNYGQNERPYGIRELPMAESSQSVFHAWHLATHGAIPLHGSCLHIPGFHFPRHALQFAPDFIRYPLREGVPDRAYGKPIHPLFQPANSVLAFDAYADEEALGSPSLLILTGSYISEETLSACVKLAALGTDVIACEWLLPRELRHPRRFAGGGVWLPTDHLLNDAARELAAPHLGSPGLWRQRFGDHAVRISPADDEGFSLHLEVE